MAEPTEPIILDKQWQLRAMAMITAASSFEMEVKHGMKLARNAPTVKEARKRWGITATKKADAAVQLRRLAEALRMEHQA